MAHPDRAIRERGPLLLDGGMGQELAARGMDTKDGLWSAPTLLEDPEAVLGVHRDYAAAGADILTTNSYAATRRRFAQHGMQDAFERANQTAGELARQAATDAATASGRPVLVAGSLPPLHGSYRPDRVRPVDELVPRYREQAELLAEFADLILCETMSTAAEALAAARGGAATGLPVWVSWTVADDGTGRLRSGESIREALDTLDGVGVEVVLVNCSMPGSIRAAMPELSTHAARPFGAYANGFSAIHGDFDVADGANIPSPRAELTPARYAAHARAWLDAGASVVGGCCEVGPAHIARLRRRLDGAGG